MVANRGKVPTCVRHSGESIVDVTRATDEVGITDWEVLKEENFSDHRYVVYNIMIGENPARVPQAREPGGWILRKEAIPELEKALKTNIEAMGSTEGTAAEQVVTDYLKVITDTCNDVLPRRKRFVRKSVYWWTGEIGEKRVSCEETRRRLKRLSDEGRKGPAGQRLLAELRDKRRDLKIAIADIKKKKWEELLQDLDRDPWSKA